MRWLAVGFTSEQVAALASRYGTEVGLVAGPLAESLDQDVLGVLVGGGDTALNDAVQQLLNVTPRWDMTERGFVFPNDPYVDPARPSKIAVGLFPSPQMGLAATTGVSSAGPASLTDMRVWGALDVGTVSLIFENGEVAQRVLVAGLRAGIDLEPRKGRRASKSLTLSISALAKRPKPLGAPLTAWEWSGPAAYLSLMNAQHLEGLRIAPRAVPHDGLLDLAIGIGSRSDLSNWRRRMPRGEHVPDPGILEMLTQHVQISGEHGFIIRLDGEEHLVRGVSVHIQQTAIVLKV